MKIPKDNRWVQTNEGEILGILHETKNITFDNAGKLTLSKKAQTIHGTALDASSGSFEHVMAIVYYNSQYVAVTAGSVYRFTLTSGSVTTDASGPSFTLATDAIVWNNRIYTTVANNLSYYDGSWTNSLESLTSGVPHPMAIFDSQPTYKLAIGDGKEVELLDSTHGASPTKLTLSDDFIVTTLAYRNGYLYVGTKNINGGEARVFIWNGSGTNAQYEVPVGASWVFSTIPYGSSVALVTSEGQLLSISGTSAIQLAAFPIYYRPDTKWIGSDTLPLNGRVFHRGMVAVGDSIYINVDGDVDTGFIPEMRSGLWVYDPEVGLYHRSSHNYDDSTGETVTWSGDTITVSTAHNLKYGDAVIFTSIGSASGLATFTPYYVNPVTSTTLKISGSRRGLENGEYITPTGDLSTTFLSYTPNNDAGQTSSTTSGAIATLSPLASGRINWGTDVIWGAGMKDKDGNTVYGVLTFTDQYNIGSFTTQKIFSGAILETWRSIYTFLDGILLEGEQAIIKYKSTEDHAQSPRLLNGVWAETNVINSGSDASDWWRDIEEGDELTIVDGYGRGYTTHVTGITRSSSVTSLTVDENIGTIGKSMTLYADTFRKVTTITKDRNNRYYVPSSLMSHASPWIMIKVELRGFEPRISHLELSNVQQTGT